MKRTSKNRHEAGEVLSWVAGVTLGLVLGAALLIVIPRVGQAQGSAAPSAEGTIVASGEKQPGEAGTEGGGGTGAVQGGAEAAGGATAGTTENGGTSGGAAGSTGAGESGTTGTTAGGNGNGTGNGGTGTSGTGTQEGAAQGAVNQGGNTAATGNSGNGNQAVEAPQGAADRENGPLSSGNRAEAVGTTEKTNTSSGQSTGATGAAGQGDEEASGNPDTRSVAEQTGAGATVAPLGDTASDVARAEGTAEDVNSFAKTGVGASGLNRPAEIVDGNPATTGEGTTQDNPGGNPVTEPSRSSDN